MRSLVSPLLGLVALASLLCACTSPPSDDADTDATGTASDDTDTDTNGDGDGDPSTSGDGDGDPALPMPAQLPAPTSACPSFASGDVEFAPAGIDPRRVKLWVGDDPQPGGLLVIYWHAFTSVPDEAAYTLSPAVIDAITAAGGVVAAPYPAADVGTFPWFAVNGSDRQDDMLVGDEIVACALEQVGVDPRRIHVTGMSAGGLQTAAFTMARSRYVASVTSFSGGVPEPLAFDDPSNHFAAMIVHGGDNDLFGGTVNFKTLSLLWYNQLVENDQFAFLCDHGMGHSIPTGWGAAVANFFFEHPYGTEPSPYAAGLPSGMPDACSL